MQPLSTPSKEDRAKQGGHRWWWYLVVIGVPLLIALALSAILLVPYFLHDVPRRALLFFGPVFFALLLVPAVAVLALAPRFSTDEKQPDYRLTHFSVRLALALGVGAVTVAVLTVAGLVLSIGFGKSW